MGAGRGIPGEGTARAKVQRPGATWPVQTAAGGFTGLESGEQWGAGRAPARQAVGLEQRVGELMSRQALCAALGSDILSWPGIGWHSYTPCLQSCAFCLTHSHEGTRTSDTLKVGTQKIHTWGPRTPTGCTHNTHTGMTDTFEANTLWTYRLVAHAHTEDTNPQNASLTMWPNAHTLVHSRTYTLATHTQGAQHTGTRRKHALTARVSTQNMGPA